MNEITTSRLPHITPPTLTGTQEPKVKGRVESDQNSRTTDLQLTEQESVVENHNNSTNGVVVAEDKLAQAMDKVRAFLAERKQHDLELYVDEESGRNVVKILDSSTGEVVKQFPAEEILNLARNMKENSSILVDLVA